MAAATLSVTTLPSIVDTKQTTADNMEEGLENIDMLLRTDCARYVFVYKRMLRFNDLIRFEEPVITLLSGSEENSIQFASISFPYINIPNNDNCIKISSCSMSMKLTTNQSLAVTICYKVGKTGEPVWTTETDKKRGQDEDECDNVIDLPELPPTLSSQFIEFISLMLTECINTHLKSLSPCTCGEDCYGKT